MLTNEDPRKIANNVSRHNYLKDELSIIDKALIKEYCANHSVATPGHVSSLIKLARDLIIGFFDPTHCKNHEDKSTTISFLEDIASGQMTQEKIQPLKESSEKLFKYADTFCNFFNGYGFELSVEDEDKREALSDLSKDIGKKELERIVISVIIDISAKQNTSTHTIN